MSWQQSNVENPFFHRGPIRDQRYFFGRVEETHQIFQFLRGGQCISVVGPRRIGKTSLLYHLCDAEVQKEHRLKSNHLLVYIDCQGLGDLDKAQLYAWLWQEARGELVKRNGTRRWQESITDFGELRAMVRGMRDSGLRLIFLLDEFETIAMNRHLDGNFFSDLRSLVPDVAYVTATTESLYELTCVEQSVLDSPFFNNFQEIPLGFLKPEEAKRMIRGLLEMSNASDLFTQEDLDFIFSTSSYHPFFIQLVCYRLFDEYMTHSDRIQRETVQQRFASDAKPHFRYIWQKLTPEQRADIRQACTGSTDQLSDARRRELEKKCLLYKGNPFSSAFAEFVRELQTPSHTPHLRPPIRKTHLTITCSKHGFVGIRICGSTFYEAYSGRLLRDNVNVDWMNRLIADAQSMPNWRLLVKGIGKELFEGLISNRPEIEKGYYRAADYIEAAQLSLALCGSRELLRLPFEALYDEDYLCLKHPMYRIVTDVFVEREPLSPPSVQANSKALVIASNTWIEGKLAPIPGVEEEAEKVCALLNKRGFKVHLLSTDEASEDRVRSELEEGKYQLLHYAGHATRNTDSPERSALLLWKGKKGESAIGKLTVDQVEILLKETSLRFVYLSCCWGADTAYPTSLLSDDFLGIMDGFVASGVPAVLGFRWSVSDQEARLLAQEFYSAWLDKKMDLAEALLSARKAVIAAFGRDKKVWFSPVLVVQA